MWGDSGPRDLGVGQGLGRAACDARRNHSLQVQRGCGCVSQLASPAARSRGSTGVTGVLTAGPSLVSVNAAPQEDLSH